VLSGVDTRDAEPRSERVWSCAVGCWLFTALVPTVCCAVGGMTSFCCFGESVADLLELYHDRFSLQLAYACMHVCTLTTKALRWFLS
jgi:hypothetical protein